MTPQKKIRIGAGFVAIWVLLGGAWLCDYFFGDTEFWKLASGELTVLLGIGAGTAMIREGRRGQEAETDALIDVDDTAFQCPVSMVEAITNYCIAHPIDSRKVTVSI